MNRNIGFLCLFENFFGKNSFSGRNNLRSFITRIVFERNRAFYFFFFDP
mgnify:CR=1 FL=1